MGSNPAINLLLKPPDTGKMENLLENGQADASIKGQIDRLCSTIQLTRRKNCPGRLFTLGYGQPILLENIRRLKWKALETMAPIQQTEYIGTGCAKVTASVKKKKKLLLCVIHATNPFSRISFSGCGLCPPQKEPTKQVEALP